MPSSSLTRLRAAMLAVAAASALSACSQVGASTTSPNTGGKTVGSASQPATMAQVCGTKKIKIAFAVGIGDNGWRQTTLAAFKDEAKMCSNITSVLYTDAGGDTGKAISDINGLVAQGVNAIVVMPDAGAALLPTLRNAYQHGVAVVPFGSPAGGTPGKDYTIFVGPDETGMGATWAKWMVTRLHGTGKVLFLGGVPGNQQSIAEGNGIRQVFAKYPGMKLLAGPVDTGWTIQGAQTAMAGALANYPEIDGVITDYGGDAIGSLQAYASAGKPLVPFTGTDENDFACAYYANRSGNPKFQIETVTSFNYMVRIAVRHAVAAAEGITDGEPTTVANPVFEDSTDPANAPRCNKDLPPGSILSSGLDDATLRSLGNGG